MAGTGVRITMRRAFPLALTIFALLSALVAMHGFSGDHDLNGPLSMAAIAHAPTGSADLDPARGVLAIGDDEAAGAPALDPRAGMGTAHRDHAAGHDDATCLALLMASMTAAAALVAARRPEGTAADVPALAAWVRAHHRACVDSFAALGPPSLSALCLSRT